MTRNLIKDFLREIRHSLNRFLSILCIVAIGVACFAGLKSAAPDMKYTMDKYYDDYNIMDIQVVSTLGLTDEDVQAIRETEGVAKVQPGYFTDAMAKLNGMETVFRLHSMPDNIGDPDTLNKLRLVNGRLPSVPGEIALENPFGAMDVGLQLGDKLTFTSGTDTPITEGTLNQDTYTIVGFVETPYYLTYDKGSSQIGGAAISFYGYIPESSFTVGEEYGMKVYVEALVEVEGARALNGFDKAYTDLVKEVKDRLTNIGTDRSLIRGTELREMATAELDAAQKDYYTQKAGFDEQIAAAEAELNNAYAKLIQGEADYENGNTDGLAQLTEAEEELAAIEKEMATYSGAITEGKAQVAAAQAQYDNAIAQSEEGRALLKVIENMMGTLDNMMNSIMSAAEPTEENQDLYNTYMDLYQSYNEEYQKVKATNANLDDMVSKAGKALSDAKRMLSDYEGEFSGAKKRIEDGQKQLAERKADTERLLADARVQLDNGWAEYEKGKAEVEAAKASGQKQLDEGEQQLIDAQFQIERIQNAEWYMLDRSTNYGYVSYKTTVDNMAAIARIIPVFFLLVAVLVCMTTMTRMVSEERGIIGTYKALGYENNAISSKYVMYVVMASLVGGVIGAAVGVRVFPNAVYNAWSQMYRQPVLEQTSHAGYIAISFVISVVLMALTAYYTCHSELVSVPAQLMRPKAPKIGKAVLMEKIPLIWNRLNFSQKVTMRNIFRYKKRLFMTVIGIMGCTALLLAALGMNDTISTVVSNQFERVFHYSFSVTTENTLTAEQVSNLESMLADPAVSHYGQTGETTATLSTENGNNSEVAVLIVAEDTAALSNYVLLRNRVTGEKLNLNDDGIILSEKLASQLGVKAGDVVNVMNSANMKKTIPVIGVTEHYIFHYAYMSQTAYQNYFWDKIPQSTLYVTTAPGADEETVSNLLSSLEQTDGIVSVSYFSEVARTFDNEIVALRSIVLLIIFCAAALAFVVLYNLTNINVSERIREIATIKVLGFKRKETALYVYREIFILSLIGALIGLGGGVILHRIIMQAIEQSNIMFGYVIQPLSFIMAVVLTLVFTVAVMAYMYRKLVTIPMVESLKSIE